MLPAHWLFNDYSPQVCEWARTYWEKKQPRLEKLNGSETPASNRAGVLRETRG